MTASSDEFSKITDQEAILLYLKFAVKENIPLTITLPGDGSNKTFKSSIRSIEYDDNELVLHKVIPANWKDHIGPGGEIDISCALPDGIVKFGGHLGLLGRAEDERYPRLNMPEQIGKRQLRAHFRIALEQFASSALLASDDGTELIGKCHDMSLSGAQVFIPKPAEPIQVGQIFEDCQILASEIINISCEAEVTRITETDKGFHIGLRFLDILPTLTKPINIALHKMQRQIIND